MKKPRRPEVPKRFRQAKEDATIPAMKRTIEDDYGLPRGSVQFVYPSGRRVRSDSTVGLLRMNWRLR